MLRACPTLHHSPSRFGQHPSCQYRDRFYIIFQSNVLILRAEVPQYVWYDMIIDVIVRTINAWCGRCCRELSLFFSSPPPPQESRVPNGLNSADALIVLL